MIAARGRSACRFLVISTLASTAVDPARARAPSATAPSGRGGPKQAGEDAIVDAMAAPLALYAQQMNVPRAIVDEMMSIPAHRLRLLRSSDLAGYGIFAVQPIVQ